MPSLPFGASLKHKGRRLPSKCNCSASVDFHSFTLLGQIPDIAYESPHINIYCWPAYPISQVNALARLTSSTRRDLFVEYQEDVLYMHTRKVSYATIVFTIHHRSTDSSIPSTTTNYEYTRLTTASPNNAHNEKRHPSSPNTGSIPDRGFLQACSPSNV